MKRLLIVCLVLILLSAGVVVWLFAGVSRPYKGYESAEQFVEIPQGAGPAGIGRRLAEAGVVRDAVTFRLAVWLTGKGRRLEAGEYRFDRPLTARQVVDMIARGEVYLRPITFPEGLTMRQMADLYEQKGFGTADAFMTAAHKTALVSSIDPAAEDLEGYLFPETYALPRRATADQLVARMVAGFQKALTPEIREQAASRGLGVRQLVTLASIVEKETGDASERALVAAVYSNRLKIGMGLQCDPTVIYALERAGQYNGNLTRESLAFDSPYNTYRYAGLPPGPIANPGRSSLEAAAHPADVSYLYFVSRNDGTHAFASTLEEHNRNVEEFQRKYFRDRKLKDGGGNP
ncbi:MAG TPA: endolytic transglycosylase MltG [Vicinamibacterales bacterium]|nr:endolytic transglycosylase MltG [Vicinamibacterales bacterium]